MSKLNLTDISIRSLKLPEKGQKLYRDKSLTGFCVRVSQGGTKTFVLVHGANRQFTTIGRVGILSLKEARQEAKRILAEHTLGKTRPTSISFEEATAQFLQDCTQKNKPRTVTDYTRLLHRHFRLGQARLHDVTQQEIMRRIGKLKDTPSEQNHAFVAARVFFKWAQRRGYIDRNLLDGLQLPNKMPSRERILTDNELGSLYSASKVFPYPYGQIVGLLVLTGQRRGEISGLRWEWIDQDQKTITFPASFTKNNRSHTFPYGKQAQAIISELPEISEYLFPASRSHIRGKPTTHFNGWPKAKVQFDSCIESVAPYTLHDIRRTFSSTLAKLETPIHITEKLLNHVSGSLSGVQAIYNRHTYIDEMREALETYEAYLDTLVTL